MKQEIRKVLPKVWERVEREKELTKTNRVDVLDNAFHSHTLTR